MGRSGYSEEDCDGWARIRWRGAVASAIRGRRGQELLKALREALDAMPEKRLAANSFVSHEGQYCTLGVLGAARGLPLDAFANEYEEVDVDFVAESFGISPALAREIMYENDERVTPWTYVQAEICGPMRPCYPDYGSHSKTVRVPIDNSAERRWEYMRRWIDQRIQDQSATNTAP